MLRTFLTILSFTILLTTYPQNQNISDGLVFDGEPYVIVNPQNTQHIVIAWMGYKWLNRVVIKTRTTFDGGISWSEPVDMGHIAGGYTSADPSMAFTNNNILYLTYIDYIKEEAVGGVYFRKSTDGGLTWEDAVQVIDIDADPDKKAIDRPWIVVDSSGVNSGNIYVTTMNAQGATASFNPYLSRSLDGGQTWQDWKYIDAENWLAGSLIQQPMATPTVNADGELHIIYPSWVFQQSLIPQYIHAFSSDGGDNFTYNTVFSSSDNVSNSLAKKGYLLRSNPVNTENLVFIFLSDIEDDADVFLVESLDAGQNWSDAVKLNDDDPVNNKMQDMLWASYDFDGDLIVAWRDRRNATDTGYMAASEFWASVRRTDSLYFSPNFKLSDSLVSYDDLLANSGNDFMCIDIKNDTLNSVWGEVRGEQSLNIWYERREIPGGVITSRIRIAEEKPIIKVFPNPADKKLFIEAEAMNSISLTDINGITVYTSSFDDLNKAEIDISSFKSGIYIIVVESSIGRFSKQINIY